MHYNIKLESPMFQFSMCFIYMQSFIIKCCTVSELWSGSKCFAYLSLSPFCCQGTQCWFQKYQYIKRHQFGMCLIRMRSFIIKYQTVFEICPGNASYTYMTLSPVYLPRKQQKYIFRNTKTHQFILCLIHLQSFIIKY